MTSCREDEELVFHCPVCNESFIVDLNMKTTIIEKGCVYCGSTITEEAFS